MLRIQVAKAHQLFAIPAELENTTIRRVKLQNRLLVKIAMQENTKMKLVKHRANHVQVVLTVLLVHPIVHIR